MPSFGGELRRERELREISLREVSEATKINMRFLQALESNDFQHLPGGVFNKGFVRAYCEFIGVDSESMVNAYLLEERKQTGGSVAADPGVLRRTAPEPAPAQAPQPPRRRLGPLAWASVLLLLALAATVLVMWYAGALERWMPAGDSTPPEREPIEETT